MLNSTEFTYTLHELDTVVAALLRDANNIRHWAFDAPMGAGKTTLIRALCHALGTTDTVNSPTFAIINPYRSNTNQAIYHMDWYRLNSVNDAIEAGVEDCLTEPEAWCFIEWPERATELLHPPYWAIQIRIVNKDTRCLTRTLMA